MSSARILYNFFCFYPHSSKTEFSPFFLQFSCVWLKSGFEHFRHLELQTVATSGPFLLSPKTQGVPNTGIFLGLDISGLGYSRDWTFPAMDQTSGICLAARSVSWQ